MAQISGQKGAPAVHEVLSLKLSYPAQRPAAGSDAMAPDIFRAECRLQDQDQCRGTNDCPWSWLNLEDGEDRGLQGSFRRSVACRPLWYQHGPFEGNDGFRPARARTPPQVNWRYILALTCHYPVGQDTRPRCQRRADGPHTGRAPRGMPETPGWPLSRRHGGVIGRTGRNPAEPVPRR